MSTHNELSYGPVIVLKGRHKGRIGLYDDDEYVRGKEKAIVYFASFGIASGYYIIPMEYLGEVNTSLLMKRHQDLSSILSPYDRKKILSADQRIGALEEIAYVEGVLSDRMFTAMLTRSDRGAKIFLSHASADKNFVRSLAVDLSNMGHEIWLDEWNILAGKSIPAKISEGLENSNFVIVVLSKNSVTSRWVETEWQAKYWDEINNSSVVVLPLLLEECVVPTLLKAKKYADFRSDYTDGLERLGHDIARHLKK